jgi:hypothetical protein
MTTAKTPGPGNKNLRSMTFLLSQDREAVYINLRFTKVDVNAVRVPCGDP